MRSAVIKGLDKLNKRLTTQDFVHNPAGDFLREWRETVKSEAISNAPKWRGDIIAALEANQDSRRFPLYARVFSDAPEARWSEYGTGALSEDPKSRHQAYRPPPERLRDWAATYGLDPYAVARGIYERGGTEPTHFFSDAERTADRKMNGMLMRFGKGIEFQAEKGG